MAPNTGLATSVLTASALAPKDRPAKGLGLAASVLAVVVSGFLGSSVFLTVGVLENVNPPNDFDDWVASKAEVEVLGVPNEMVDVVFEVAGAAAVVVAAGFPKLKLLLLPPALVAVVDPKLNSVAAGVDAAGLAGAVDPKLNPPGDSVAAPAPPNLNPAPTGTAGLDVSSTFLVSPSWLTVLPAGSTSAAAGLLSFFTGESTADSTADMKTV